MKVNPEIFRGYDMRGVVDKDLTPELYEHLGRAYATFVKRNNLGSTVVIGRDARSTSEDYSESMINGINWAGLNVVDIGLTFVGTFYWSQHFLNHKAGVFVTASHNPSNYNGGKFSVGLSETMVSSQIQELRNLVQDEDYDKGNELGVTEKKDVKKDYISDLQERIKIDKPLKVLVDTGFSSGGVIVPDVFKAFGLKVVEKNTSIDSSFPLGAPNPADMETAERLSREVKETQVDVGFSYDSDGDRIGIVDEKGQIIWNDMLVALFSVAILDKHPGSTIMYNNLCSLAVEETIKKYGGKPFMWKTGHSFLKKKNQEVKAAFIGELSGHFFFSEDFYNHDDGIYSTLRLVSYIASTGQKLSELIKELPQYVSSPEITVGYPDEKKKGMIENLAKKIRSDKPESIVIDDERMGDGVRVETDTSMFVVRYSQNGPYIVVKIEAKTKSEYEELRKYLAKIISNYKDINWSFGDSQEMLKVDYRGAKDD